MGRELQTEAFWKDKGGLSSFSRLMVGTERREHEQTEKTDWGVVRHHQLRQVRRGQTMETEVAQCGSPVINGTSEAGGGGLSHGLLVPYTR